MLIDITEHLKARRALTGDEALMTCECQMREPSPKGFLPTVLRDAAGEILTGLACAACGCAYRVAHGRLVEEPGA